MALTETPRPAFGWVPFEGDKVHVKSSVVAIHKEWAGTWIVERVNKVNLSVRNGTRSGRIHPSFVEAGPDPSNPDVSVPDPPAFVSVGTLARVADDTTSKIPPGLYVVTGQTAKGVRLFPLGGSTRYYTNVQPKVFEVIDPKRVTISD